MDPLPPLEADLVILRVVFVMLAAQARRSEEQGRDLWEYASITRDGLVNAGMAEADIDALVAAGYLEEKVCSFTPGNGRPETRYLVTARGKELADRLAIKVDPEGEADDWGAGPGAGELPGRAEQVELIRRAQAEGLECKALLS